ncbi:hypothetical protein [Microbacterium sp. CR_7]|uniref:hypothetical protein n=1 Tax=Microbacterium sp. CR_7 TaxID=3055792 RepID=UPI0035C24B60
MATPTFLTKAELAATIQRSTRTIELWLRKGYITGYRDEDGTLKFHLEAVELAMSLQPFKMRDGRKRGSGTVVPMPIQAVPE